VERRVKKTVKNTIEMKIWEEYDIALARKKHQRLTGDNKGYRSGSYKRSISTTHGRADDLRMPKSKGIRIKYDCLEFYRRRQPEFDEHILKAMVLGLTSRKQAKFFRSFIGDSVSHTTASRIMNKIAYLVNYYRNMPLSDEYEYLYLDAIWVHVKELNIKNRPILLALGVKTDGTKYILTFKLARSESEAEWLGLINDLYRRGLKGFNLSLIISDNCPGLKSAINYVYPYVALQLCTVHKMRNVLSKIRNKTQNRKKLMRQASKIFKSNSQKEAIARYNKFLRDWSAKEPAVIRTMKKDIEYYFTYFNFPQDKRDSLKSTNPLERINRELRKITRRFGYFQNQKNLDVFIHLSHP
jgi:putative transposase